MIWKQGNKQPGEPVTLSKQTADVYVCKHFGNMNIETHSILVIKLKSTWIIVALVAECFHSCTGIFSQKLSYRIWTWSVKLCRCWHTWRIKHSSLRSFTEVIAWRTCEDAVFGFIYLSPKIPAFLMINDIISTSSGSAERHVNRFCGFRYRAVASWSRVQGVGIPLFTAMEIFTIWVLSIILAVPEAVVFNMVTFTYNNQTFRTCMLKPESDFTRVGFFQIDVVFSLQYL